MDQNNKTEDSTNGEPRETSSEQFKKPQMQMCLVGPRKGKGVNFRKVELERREESVEKQVSSDVSPPEEDSVSSVETSQPPPEPQKDVELKKALNQVFRTDSSKEKNFSGVIIPAQKLKEVPIPYIEPKWSSIAEEKYSLDVIKDGAVISSVDLNTKPYHVFGRLTNCDVVMAHPTVSRHHSVLQYSVGTNEKPKGFYVYDLGSTHGTFLNKNRIRPEMFVPLKVGHQLKIGCSSRIYLLQGPPEDMEEESEFTVTELKAQRQLRLQERELAELERKRKEEELKEKRENEGIDWGMGDDADEETDLSENPYAATTNEDLYVDDPKKSLRGWFDREGHELEYDIEEKGPGQFLCRVDVPVEGARGGCMTAEALVKGKKKEAVVQCALEACRLLDRLGLLRQATHESRKRKAKNWEEDDFYDSDDDTFLDRTGSVEKKRQQRMKQAGKAEVQVETFESLSKKHSDILERLNSVQVQLDKALSDLAASKKQNSNEDDADTLDSFMNSLKTKGCPDKKQLSKLKAELSSLQKEEAEVRKLVNIARPASLPELILPSNSGEGSQVKDSNAIKNKIFLNARKIADLKKKVLPGVLSLNEAQPPVDESNKVKEEREMNEEKAREEKMNEGIEGRDCHEKIHERMEISTNERLKISTDDPSHLAEGESSGTKEQRAVLGPVRPSYFDEKISEALGDNEEVEEQSIDDEDVLKDAEKRKRRNRRRLLQRAEKALEKTKGSYDTSDPNYSVWVPPEDQSGDGKTKLNEKLGY